MKIQNVFLFYPHFCIRSLQCDTLDNIYNSIGFIQAMLLDTKYGYHGGVSSVSEQTQE
jgi:hypothetical protein